MSATPEELASAQEYARQLVASGRDMVEVCTELILTARREHQGANRVREEYSREVQRAYEDRDAEFRRTRDLAEAVRDVRRAVRGVKTGRV